MVRGAFPSLAAAIVISLAGPLRAEPELGGVVTADGGALAGAVVEARPRVAATSPAAPVAARATSDRTGRYRLALPAPGPWEVAVRHPKRAAASFPTPPLAGDLELPRVELPRAAVRRLVLVVGGRPRAGLRWAARCWSAAWEARSRDGWWPATAAGVTAADGGVELACARGDAVTVAAFAGPPERAEAGDPFVYRTLDGLRGGLELELDGTMVEARVLAADGHPAHGVVGLLRWPAIVFAAASGPEAKIVLPWRDGLVFGFADELGPFGDPVLLREGDLESGPLVVRLPPAPVAQGVVVDAASGEPLAGAWVRADRGSGHLATTRADGRFALRLLGEATSLRAAAAGHLEASARLVEGPLPLRLLATGALAGRTLDDRGQPVAGARLAAAPAWHQVRGDRRELAVLAQASEPAPLAATAGDDGSFRLAGALRGLPYRLRVSAPGHAPAELLAPPVDEGGEALEVVLETGVTLVGAIVDERDRPVGGARIQVAAAGDGPFGRPEPRTATSDALGHFAVADLAAGSYDLAADAPGRLPARLPGLEVVGGSPRFDLGTLTLEPAWELAGSVVGPAGRGLADVELTADLGERGEAVRATSGADGTFVLAPLRPDQAYRVTARKAGLWTAEERVAAGRREPLVLRLGEASRLRGRVVDRAGAPRGGVLLALVARDRLPASRQLTSGDDGAFELADLEPGDYLLKAVAETADDLALHVGERGLDDVVFTVDAAPAAPGRRLRGRVVDAADEPLARATVEAREAPESSAAPAYGGLADTGADGRFDFGTLRMGTWLLRASHPRYRSVEATVELLEGDPGPVELRLAEPVDVESLRISGLVVDRDGRPVAGAKLELRRDASLVAGASFADGRFDLLAPEPGAFTLFAYHPLAGTARAETEAGAVDLRLELGPTATAVGRVLGLDEGRRGEVRIEAVRPGERRVGTVDWAGAFRVAGLEPGAWELDARLAATWRIAVPFEVPEGASEVEVDVRFELGPTVEGQVWLGSAPLAGAAVRVSCLDRDRGYELDTRTGRDGRFSAPGLPPRGCTVLATDPESGASAGLAVDTSGPAPILDVTLVLEPALLEGSVVAAASLQPLPGVAVAARSDTGGDAWAMSDGEGRFSFRLQRGRWTLQVRQPGLGAIAQEVEVDGPTRVRLIASPAVGLVVMVEGEPVPEVFSVEAFDAQGREVEAAIGVGGRAELANLPAGRYRLRIEEPSGRWAEVEATIEGGAPGPPLRVRLEPAG